MKSALHKSTNIALIHRQRSLLNVTKDAFSIELLVKNRQSTWRSSSNSSSTDGNRFLAKLDPMKRILCLCPVPIRYNYNCNEDTIQKRGASKIHMNIGVAVSDPYLGYAIPVQTHSFIASISFGANDKVSFQSFPESIEHLSECIDYHDIGSVVIGLPLYNGQDDMNKDMVEMQNVQQTLHQKFEQNSQFTLTHSRIKDVLSIHDRTSYTKVLEMAMEEPEMWEEIAIPEQTNQVIGPEIHAAAVLNVFLWNHTGGWRNTFA